MFNIGLLQPSPPGDTLLNIMEERDITPEALAAGISESTEFVARLLDGRERITHRVACALSEFIGSSAQFWISRDARYFAHLNAHNEAQSKSGKACQ